MEDRAFACRSCKALFAIRSSETRRKVPSCPWCEASSPVEEIPFDKPGLVRHAVMTREALNELADEVDRHDQGEAWQAEVGS